MIEIFIEFWSIFWFLLIKDFFYFWMLGFYQTWLYENYVGKLINTVVTFIILWLFFLSWFPREWSLFTFFSFSFKWTWSCSSHFKFNERSPPFTFRVLLNFILNCHFIRIHKLYSIYKIFVLAYFLLYYLILSRTFNL